MAVHLNHTSRIDEMCILQDDCLRLIGLALHNAMKALSMESISYILPDRIDSYPKRIGVTLNESRYEDLVWEGMMTP